MLVKTEFIPTYKMLIKMSYSNNVFHIYMNIYVVLIYDMFKL